MNSSMNGELLTERNGDVAIVRVRCRIAPGCGLQRTMRDLAQAGVKCVLLDLSEATDIDSSGLGELAAGHASATKAGCGTMLLNVNPRAKELLRFARLGSAFPTYYGAASIVRSVLANRPQDQREAEQSMLSEVYIG